MSGKVQTKLNTTNVNNNFKKEKSRGLPPSTLKQPIELISHWQQPSRSHDGGVKDPQVAPDPQAADPWSKGEEWWCDWVLWISDSRAAHSLWPLQAALGQTAGEAASEPEAVRQLKQSPRALQVGQQPRLLLAQVMLQALRLQRNTRRPSSHWSDDTFDDDTILCKANISASLIFNSVLSEHTHTHTAFQKKLRRKKPVIYPAASKIKIKIHF